MSLSPYVKGHNKASDFWWQWFSSPQGRKYFHNNTKKFYLTFSLSWHLHWQCKNNEGKTAGALVWCKVLPQTVVTLFLMVVLLQ